MQFDDNDPLTFRYRRTATESQQQHRWLFDAKKSAEEQQRLRESFDDSGPLEARLQLAAALVMGVLLVIGLWAFVLLTTENSPPPPTTTQKAKP